MGACISPFEPQQQTIAEWRQTLHQHELQFLIPIFEYDHRENMEEWSKLPDCYLERYGLNNGANKTKWDNLLSDPAWQTKLSFKENVEAESETYGDNHTRNKDASHANARRKSIAKAAEFFSQIKPRLREYIRGKPQKRYDGFFSHVQSISQQMCAKLAVDLGEKRMKIWFDQAKVADIDTEGILAGIAQSETFVIVASDPYFRRPYCCFELMCALALNKPTLVVYEIGSSEKGGFSSFSDFKRTVPPEFKEILNPMAERLVRRDWEENVSRICARMKNTEFVLEGRRQAVIQLTQKAKLEVQARAEKLPPVVSNSQTQSVLLFLGAGDSGKSTVYRNMLSIWATNGAVPRGQSRDAVHSTILKGMRSLIELNDQLTSSDPEKYKHLLMSPEIREQCGLLWPKLNEEEVWNDTARLIRVLWNDDPRRALKQTYVYRYKAHIPDSLSMFLENVERIGERFYIPTAVERLGVRVRTLGVHETELFIQGRRLNVLDVGGQRNERSKWVYGMDCADVILFCVSLIGYCQLCEEDESTNRMLEALNLFKTVSKSLPQSTSLNLLFTKFDLLGDRLKHEPFDKYFTDYTDDPMSHQSVVEYTKNLFMSASNRDIDKILTVNAIKRSDVVFCMKSLLK